MPAVSSNISTPLSTLLTMLRSEGFVISTSTLIDIQKVLANLDIEQAKDFSALRPLLSPLICRNKEEQERFNHVFDRYVQYIKERRIDAAQNVTEYIKRRNYKKIAWIAASAIVVLFAIIYFFFIPPNRTPLISVNLVSNEPSAFILTDSPVTFRAEVRDTIASHKYFVTTRINGKVYENTREVTTSFSEPGTPEIVAWLLDEKRDTLNSYELADAMVLCEKPPSVSIVKNQDSAAKKGMENYSLQFTNDSVHGDQYTYKWYINDELVSNAPTIPARKPGDSGYVVKVVVDTKKFHCSTDSLTAMFFEKPEYQLSVIGTKPIATAAIKDWNRIIPALLFFGVLPVLLAVILFFRKAKRKERKQKDAAADQPKEYTGPYKIMFEDQSDKISPEGEISELAGAMRKRHANDLTFLNVPKTIQATIRAGGFPELHFSSRTTQTDFLILIDKENPEALHVTLFEYLLKKLENEQVNINSYSYYKEPLLLSNEKLNQSMLPVDKVARLYPNTVLVIFSDTASFFDTLSTNLKSWVTEKFKTWEHKIIITPVPVNDWDYKENTLLRAGFTVVPADLNANHIITNEINNLINPQKFRKENIPPSYSSRFINFNDWKQLKSYFGGDDLMVQWVAALAVYPYIDWKATVAIGKALEEQKGQKGKLVNYTRLLKLSRIKWMQTGIIPDELRLEMLANLDNQTEVIARDTMVTLFQQVSQTITPSSLIAGEFELHNTVNKFLLHSHAPNDYALTEEEHTKMKEYIENQWLDRPLEKYLDDADNTLLKNENAKSISPSEYFQLEDDLENKRQHRHQIVRRLLAAAIVVAAILLSYNFFSDADNYSVPRQFADLTFTLASNSITGTLANKELSVSVNDQSYQGQKISDTSILVKGVKIDSVQEGRLLLNIDSTTLEQSFDLNSSAYSIAVLGPKALVPLNIRYNDQKAYATMQQQIDEAFPGFNISALQSDFSDSSRIVYYENDQKSRADSIVQLAKAKLGINVSEEFISEKRTPPATPILFLNLKSNACNTIAANALPAALNDIWKGGTSNRLLNINPIRKLMYYSTGDKKTYGTYRIEEICLNTDGLYRIITNAGNGYQDFLIRNVKPSSFELSVCQNRYKTIEEARSVDETYCDHFNIMRIFFENDDSKAFLNQQGKLPATQLDKLKKVVYVRNANMLLFKLSLATNTANTSSVSLNEMKALVKNSLPGRFSYQQEQFRGTPFDRNYVSIDDKTKIDQSAIEIPAGADVPTKVRKIVAGKLGVPEAEVTLKASLTNDLGADDLDKVELVMALEKEFNVSIPEQKFQSIATVGELTTFIEALLSGVDKSVVPEALLTRVYLDEKGYPDAAAQAALKQVMSYLSGYKNASTRIVFYYSDDYSQKMAMGYINSLRNYLQQFKYNSSQVKFETKNVPGQAEQQQAAQQQQQQSNAAPQVQQKSLPRTNALSKSYQPEPYADVYGTGFPADFSNSLNRKASAK